MLRHFINLISINNLQQFRINILYLVLPMQFWDEFLQNEGISVDVVQRESNNSQVQESQLVHNEPNSSENNQMEFQDHNFYGSNRTQNVQQRKEQQNQRQNSINQTRHRGNRMTGQQSSKGQRQARLRQIRKKEFQLIQIQNPEENSRCSSVDNYRRKKRSSSKYRNKSLSILERGQMDRMTNNYNQHFIDGLRLIIQSRHQYWLLQQAQPIQQQFKKKLVDWLKHNTKKSTNAVVQFVFSRNNNLKVAKNKKTFSTQIFIRDSCNSYGEQVVKKMCKSLKIQVRDYILNVLLQTKDQFQVYLRNLYKEQIRWNKSKNSNYFFKGYFQEKIQTKMFLECGDISQKVKHKYYLRYLRQKTFLQEIQEIEQHFQNIQDISDEQSYLNSIHDTL